MNLRKKDYLFALIIAEIDALIFMFLMAQGQFILPDIEILNIVVGYLYITLPIICVIALWLANQVSKFIKGLLKLAKFVLVGTSNVFVDLLGLLLLTMFVNPTTYILATILKGVSFLIATANSYFWNKTWTFEGEGDKEKSGKEITNFYLVSGVGLAINMGAFYIFKMMFPNLPVTALGIFAAFISVGWNFIGYKVFVFKK